MVTAQDVMANTPKPNFQVGITGIGIGMASVISVPSAATANDSRAINSIVGQFWRKKSVASWKLRACT
jgi:hypothetical protein